MSANAHRDGSSLVRRARAWAVSCVMLIGFGALAHAPEAADAPPPPPVETVRLTNGSVLVGRIVARGERSLRMLVEGAGEITVDSTAIAPTAHVMPGHGARWSGNLSAGVLYVSEIAPGIVGSNLGVELRSRVARAFDHGSLSLDGSLGYDRVEPDPATIDRWGLTLGSRRNLPGRYLVLATARYEVNRVQYLRYRSTVLGGIGYEAVKHPKVSLIVAPGLGYSKSEQTDYGRVLSFGNRQPPGVEGAAWGVHDMLMVQLLPTVVLQQELLWLRSLESGAFRQAQYDVRLTGTVTQHVKMLIVYSGQYDSSMPAPVRRTVQSINSGVQLEF